MKIVEVTPRPEGVLHVVAADGRSGIFDVRPYVNSPPFQPLKDWAEFSQVRNGGYYVEWRCGADFSADTIEARWTIQAEKNAQQTVTAGATMHC